MENKGKCCFLIFLIFIGIFENQEKSHSGQMQIWDKIIKEKKERQGNDDTNSMKHVKH